MSDVKPLDIPVFLRQEYLAMEAKHKATIERLRVALRSVRTILQGDDIEYDDMRHIDHIIDEALAAPPSTFCPVCQGFHRMDEPHSFAAPPQAEPRLLQGGGLIPAAQHCDCFPLAARGEIGDQEIYCPKCGKVFRAAAPPQAQGEGK